MINLNKEQYPYLEEAYVGLIKQIPPHTGSSPGMVLDVACGLGTVAQAIQSKGYTVWGIERSEAAAREAFPKMSRMIHCDITQLEKVGHEIGGQTFDYIIFSHILEHLYDPLSILKHYLTFLKPGGRVIVAVPNVAVWTNRLSLLFGRFNYIDTGVMDRTHIRFFTFKTAKELVRAAGCSIVGVDYDPFFIRAFLPLIKRWYRLDRPGNSRNRKELQESPLYRRYLKYVYPVEYCLGYFLKPLFAFDIIVVATKA
ncbi:MAG: class I SAM-dependent methyltransferase [Candidatus Aureabacteria bacterium]|nr:class I SAM-dependent methyltransferase [Candidatus Auribacterota bacterium]